MPTKHKIPAGRKGKATRKDKRPSQNVFRQGSEILARRALKRLNASDTRSDAVIRIARIALIRKQLQGSVYKPMWRLPLKRLSALPSSKALAEWWLRLDDNLRTTFGQRFLVGLMDACWAIADVKGSLKTPTAEGFRRIVGDDPIAFRRLLLSRADAIEEITNLSREGTRIVQAAYGQSTYSQLTAKMNALHEESEAMLEVALRHRDEAAMIGSRGRAKGNAEGVERAWIVKPLGKTLEPVPASTRRHFIADLLVQFEFGVKDTLRYVRTVLEQAAARKSRGTYSAT